MFRGVLYRHLRDATSSVGYVGSVLASALATSFVFAAIHPQGWIAVPALMSLAMAFTLAREWRGTLLPSMIAHGINNGLLTWILISLG
jgi:membrane protease YdiL (CAAX protease family)